MGNRSKYVVALGSAAAGMLAVRGVQRRHRARLSRAGRVLEEPDDLARDILPRALADMDDDPAHAPGHRHLPLADVLRQPEPPRVDERPFAKHHRGLRHPGKI